jgi:nitrogen-specific signal transduction histidine kinase
MPLTARHPSVPLHRALLRAVCRDVDEGLVVLDATGRVRDLNAPAQRMLGWTTAAARRRPASEVLRSAAPGDDVVDGQPLEREVLLLARGGGELPVLVRRHRLGRGRGELVTLRDLSGLRRLQQEIRLRDRLATLGQLSAGVAHEIRNPLAGIGTSAQVLLRRFEPRDERARFVQVILEEVRRLDRIVDSLLQYARPQPPELKSNHLHDCVKRVLALVGDTVTQHHVRVETRVMPRLPAVYIDADLVTQVLLNISLNALQAMPEGGTLVFVVGRVRRRAAPRGPGRRRSDLLSQPHRAAGWVEYQQIKIADTGRGIPRHLLPKLFDPFFSTRPQGTGLGLAISQTIMHEHGGAIEIASREGHGTTVLLNFPVEKRHDERRKHRAHPVHADAAHR